MKVLVLLNSQSGALATSRTFDEAGRIMEGFAACGIEAEVRSLDAGELVKAAQATQAEANFAAVVAGGGDGTINAIASVLAGGVIPFGVLPLGTHNHFAKELQVPLDLEAAVAALADALSAGRSTDLDVGQVNGRLFLNFSAIGLHPQVARQRDLEHKSLGRFKLLKWALRKLLKLLALVIAFAKAMAHPPVRRVWIDAGGKTVRRTTPSVIVCNNSHQMQMFGLANLTQSDRCVLNVLIARAKGPAGLLRLLIASLLRRLRYVREFEVMCLSGLTIRTRRPRITVSIDGEVLEMRTPLEYSVRRGGLRVISPAPRVAATEAPGEPLIRP